MENENGFKGNTYGIYIKGPTKKTARQLEKAVMKVLNSRAGDDVKKEAMKVLAEGLGTNANINNCSLNMNGDS